MALLGLLASSCGQGSAPESNSDATEANGAENATYLPPNQPLTVAPPNQGVPPTRIEVDEYGVPLHATAGPEARRLVGELIEAFRPIALDLTSDHHDRQIMEQREIYQRLIAAGPEVGGAALQAFTAAGNEPMLVRRALLWVGSKAAPAEAEDLLAELMDTYGYRIEDRTEAALALAESSPNRYFEIARPYLERRERLKKFMPDDEFLVAGWVNASIVKQVSPVPMLADIATNMLIMPNARSAAAIKMREFPNEVVGQRALETCLIESSGDTYLRRMAAQSLVVLLPNETACALIEETFSREQDINMVLFLENILLKHCR